MRTAEVTVCILPKGCSSASTVTARLKTQVVEDNVYGVIAQGANVLLMLDYHDIRTELIEIDAISSYTVS